ncbi:hypothetical protein ACQFX6_23445 [Streptomyces sp. DSM 41987]|uniref:hypothetical protein n=1 Tax=Streptomyces TaxID=1883 RepID=UPI0036181521
MRRAGTTRAATGATDGVAAWFGRWPVRRHTVALTLWTVCWFVVTSRNGGVSWHYLRTGGRLLTGGGPGGGLAIYQNHPELQIGPVSFLTAALFEPFPPGVGERLAEAFMSGLGLYMLVVVGRTAADFYAGTGINHRRLQQRVLIAGLAFIPMWVEVSVRFAHLDDVLALFFTALAVRALVRGRPAAVGILLALAVDSKPWALSFLPLLLALPRAHWRRAACWLVALVAVAWLPFYVTHLGSAAAARFAIPNQPASALRWFGVADAVTPGWDRPAQALLGLALGTVAVLRGRWPAVVLLGADARIALDPSVYTYYSASVLLGTLLWDAVGQRRLVPWWSWIALLSLYGSALLVPSESAQGLIRLSFAAVSAAYVLLWPMKKRTRPRAGGRRAAATGSRRGAPAPIRGR